MPTRFRITLAFVVLLTTVTAIYGQDAPPMTDAQVETLATRFAQAFRRGEPLPKLSRSTPGVSLNDGYRVQRSWVFATLDEHGIGGIKGGAASKSAQKMFGLDGPGAALLRESGRLDLSQNAIDGVYQVDLTGWDTMRIETELAFVVGKAIDEPIETIREFRDHIRAIAPAIELPAGRNVPGKTTAADFVATNVNAALYIVGSETRLTDESIEQLSIPFVIELSGPDGNLIDASTSEYAGGIWEVGRSLSNHASRQGITLLEGQVILCGKVGAIPPANPGHYIATFGPLGEIRFACQ